MLLLARKLEFRKKELISKIYHSYIKKEYSREENTPFLIYIPFTTIFYIIMNKRLSGNFWLVSFKISYLCLPLFLKPERLLRAILPDVLIDNFDIVNFDKSADRFDIYS